MTKNCSLAARNNTEVNRS